MITSISLENWKSHSKSSFSFSRGTNVLVGRMGSGKSSVLDALCFALYGTFPKMGRRDQTVEDLVNLSSGAEYAAVSLEFERSGQKYQVMRRIGKKISEAEVRCEGKLMQKGPKPCTDYLAGVLGVDYDLFTRAIYSEQNKIDYLLSLNPRARKQEIDWLLGLGQFDLAREGAQQAHGKLSEQAESLAADASAGKLDAAEKKAAEMRQQTDGAHKALAQLREKAEAQKALSSEREAAMASLEKTRAEWKILQNGLLRHKGALERLSREADGRKRPEKAALQWLEMAASEAGQKLSEAKAQEKETQGKLSAKKGELAVLQSQLKSAIELARKKGELEQRSAALSGGKDLKFLDAELSMLREEMETLNANHAKVHAQINELGSAAESLLGVSAKCPVCDSDLSGGKAGEIRADKVARMQASQAQAARIAEELAKKKSEIYSLEKNIAALSLALSQVARMAEEGAETSQIEAKAADAASEAKLLGTEAENLEKLVAGFERAKEAARRDFEEATRAEGIFDELEAAQAKAAQAEKEAAALKFDETAYEAARKECESARLEAARAESEARGEERQLALLREMHLAEEKALFGLREKAALAKKYTDAAESMAIYRNALSEAQSELRAQLVEEINQALAEIWPAVYPYSDYGAVKLEADEKDYRLLMEKSGWREVDSVASGGERACLCLALRVSFATVLTPDIGWLILDEPTHNLDSEAVLLLSEAIKSKIPSIVEQTFVITHDMALGENSEGTVWRLERDKAKNEPSRAERL